MKKINPEGFFLDERLINIVSVISVICGCISLILLLFSGEADLLTLFDKAVKIIVTLLTMWSFSKFHWDVMKGMMGGLLFALLYQESFLVLGKLWGETTDFDMYLIMGVSGSLYLAAQSMSFLVTGIIIINHFVIDYSRAGNQANVIFNQISIFFKVFLYVFLMIINLFLNQSMMTQLSSGFEYASNLCIVILVVCIETHLDSFKFIRHEMLSEKKMSEKSQTGRTEDITDGHTGGNGHE